MILLLFSCNQSREKAATSVGSVISQNYDERFSLYWHALIFSAIFVFGIMNVEYGFADKASKVSWHQLKVKCHKFEQQISLLVLHSLLLWNFAPIALLIAGSLRAGADDFNQPYIVIVLAALKLFSVETYIFWNIWISALTHFTYTAKADGYGIYWFCYYMNSINASKNHIMEGQFFLSKPNS